jgi:hypothetical protein
MLSGGAANGRGFIEDAREQERDRELGGDRRSVKLRAFLEADIREDLEGCVTSFVATEGDRERGSVLGVRGFCL